MTEPFLKVQRVSLTMWGIAFLGLLATMLEPRWIGLTGFVFIAGLAGMFVQATGRLRVFAILVNLFLVLFGFGGLVTIVTDRSTDWRVLLIPVCALLIILSAMNVWFIARLPKGDGLEQT
jgi:hypothetical protein